ncbi:pre-mRNA-splicing factor syf2 [Delitschia confertaspora ATCC 74209]|uniref:Pre-mRNA-splicing factor SYF2 n=1 Tax=Delitschia confertaspora ATCC 74209 TaxID=1513339 RepID=A0A9P4JNK6_9PLEO|nr:pre-mRNA-splicing factor syf2 [Delitschia confertaspora ATCC 74209]
MASDNETSVLQETAPETTTTTQTEPAAETTPAVHSPVAEEAPANDTQSALQARIARFNKAKLQAAKVRQQNLKDAQAEAKRVASDPKLLEKLERKRVNASEKLLKEETEDFERKRAWDWTAEESEKWDKRVEKKQRHRDNVSFANYGDEANKSYKRQIKNLESATTEEQAKRKRDEITRAVARGDLELVEDDDGNVRAVDRKGTFYAQPEQYQFDHKPSDEAIDRLVQSLEKEEAKRLKNRGQRARREEGGDVTYINEKNKQFNDKLTRFYNKYTADIRESFERGTAM